MIVVASDNAVVVDDISTLLRQRGDLFTVAADETLALSAIRADRASLLIIDTGSAAFNGFAFCREVKGDPALSTLPVLCIIEPVDLTQLLSVLDCSADGFLCLPCDLGSLSAAIEDLQDRQTAGPEPRAVRTQFRISHDGKDYVVAADRRQLLEFLVAAFETAVRVRREQEQMRTDLKEEIRCISERLGILTAERDATVKNLHEELEGLGREISRMNAAIQAREQAEFLLKTQKENVSQELRELGAVLEATRKSDEEKSAKIATLTASLAEVTSEKARSDQAHAAAVLALETQLKTAATELDSACSDLIGVNARIEELETRVQSLVKERDALAQSGDDLAGQLAEARAGLGAEREIRIQVQTECDAVALERERLEDVLASTYRELAAVQEESARLRSELAGCRTTLDETADLKRRVDQLAADLSVARASVAEEQKGRSLAESRVAALEESTAGTQKFLDSAARDIGVLNAALSEERERRKTTEDRRIALEQESLEKDREIGVLRQELDAIRSAATQKGPILIGPQDPVPLQTREANGVPVVSQAPEKPADKEPEQVQGKPVPEGIPAEAPVAVTGQQAGSDQILSPAPPYQMTLPSTEPPIPLPGPSVSAGTPHEAVDTLSERKVTAASREEAPPSAIQETGDPHPEPSRSAPGDLVISRDRWLDITKWAHHTTAVTDEQRKDLIANLMRLSKLVQKGRHLTNRQEQEIRILVARVQSLGYRFV